MNNEKNYNLENMTIEELEELKKELAGKTLIPDSSEREKTFVETMSSNAQIQREAIQQRRDEQYEQMIAEAGEIESPMSRRN